jgi:hypothetical protein
VTVYMTLKLGGLPMCETHFIDPKLIKLSEYPTNFIPDGAITIGTTIEGCTIKGFYDHATEEYHIQEFICQN